MQGGPEGERRAVSRDDHVTVSCHDWRPTWPLSPPVASRKSINIADPKAWLPELVERAAGGEESHLAKVNTGRLLGSNLIVVGERARNRERPGGSRKRLESTGGTSHGQRCPIGS